MTDFLTFDDVLEIRRGIAAPGPLLERKRSDLEAALGEPAQSWDGAPLHETTERQAAVLLRGIVAAHAFEDGNKRTAWMSCVVFLARNGLTLRAHPREAADRVVSVATDHPPIEEIERWLATRSVAIALPDDTSRTTPEPAPGRVIERAAPPARFRGRPSPSRRNSLER